MKIDMVPDKIIYTDGRTVTVTDSMFQVDKMEYRLNGITKHGLYVLRPHRFPAILLVVIGLVFMVLGLARLVPPTIMNDVIINDTLVHANTIAIGIGALLAFIGVLIVGLMRERYAVRISTAEGEKNVVVSRHKEYIAQIVDALSSAYKYLRNTAAGNFWREKK
jgi:TM2 domain-containing membrane protein YozV